MHYTQLFRHLREAQGLTIEELASRARRHRNTVFNVEAGRPVKFTTVSTLMRKMGYASDSLEMRCIALLWLEAISGLTFSASEVDATAQAVQQHDTLAHRSTANLAAAVIRAGLGEQEIGTLRFAVDHPAALAILSHVRALQEQLVAKSVSPPPRPPGAPP